MYLEEEKKEKEKKKRGRSMVGSLSDFINIYDNHIITATSQEIPREEREQALMRAQCIEISIEEELMTIQLEMRTRFLEATRSLTHAPEATRGR